MRTSLREILHWIFPLVEKVVGVLGIITLLHNVWPLCSRCWRALRKQELAVNLRII